MELQSEVRSGGRPELLHEARKIARDLRACAEEAIPRLDTSDADEILAQIDLYADLGGHLQSLFTRIETMDTSGESLAEAEECRELRREIRVDLDAAGAFVAPCRAALTRQMDAVKKELLLTQRRRQISAYIRIPLSGDGEGAAFDRRD